MNPPAQFTQSVHLQGFNPDHLMEAVRGARFEHYILARTSCDARLKRWCLGDFSVDVGRYSFPVLVTGAFPAQRLSVGYMRDLRSPARVNGLRADRSTMEFYPGGTELNYRAAPEGEWAVVEFGEESIQAAAMEVLGHPVELPWRHVTSLSVDAGARARLDRMVDQLWSHPLSGTLMVAPILRHLAVILHSQKKGQAPHSQAPGQTRKQAVILSRSDEYLRDYPENPFQLEALASASGTTVRTLQRIFREAYGMTPQQWARCFALHRAHRILRSQEAAALAVHEIARSCGFRHMGRFSEYYRGLFGELPSSTLAAAMDTPGESRTRGEQVS